MNLSQHVANVGPLADAVDASGEASILVESLMDAASLRTLDSTMLSIWLVRVAIRKRRDSSLFITHDHKIL